MHYDNVWQLNTNNYRNNKNTTITTLSFYGRMVPGKQIKSVNDCATGGPRSLSKKSCTEPSEPGKDRLPSQASEWTIFSDLVPAY